MARAGTHFYARLSFPDERAKQRWLDRPVDPFAAGELLAPFRRCWTESPRTGLFGSSVGLSHVEHDEAGARRALGPLISGEDVARVERIDEADGTRSWTFYLAGALPGDTTIRRLFGRLRRRRAIRFVRTRRAHEVKLYAWLKGYDAFEDYIEVLVLAALRAADLVTSGYGVFFPEGASHDLCDYGELEIDRGRHRFVVRDLQDFTEKSEAWLNEALPRLRMLQKS